jgi:hypothetical protein
MVLNQRGMEMAIQIFIVLFVLLAVAMLVLQLVSTQFSQNENQLKEVQEKNALASKIKTAQVDCQTLARGTKDQQVAYCLKSFSFTEKTVGVGYLEDLVPGIRVCEDKIYCVHLTGENTMASCVTTLCDYWMNTQGMLAAEATKLLRQYITPGKCTWDVTNSWYKILVPTATAADPTPTTFKCRP